MYAVIAMILFFTADWCQPCHTWHRTERPILIKAGWVEGRDYKIINVDKRPDLVEKYDVEQIPLAVIEYNGVVYARVDELMLDATTPKVTAKELATLAVKLHEEHVRQNK